MYIYCIYFQPWKWEDDSNLLTISYIYIVYSMYIHSIYTYIYILYYIILVGGDWNMAFMTFHIGISSSPGRAEKNRAISPECETHGDIPWGEQKTCDLWVVYPLVNSHITMENHNFSWVNPLFLWPFSIAMLVYQRVLSWQNGQILATNPTKTHPHNMKHPHFSVPVICDFPTSIMVGTQGGLQKPAIFRMNDTSTRTIVKTF